MLAASQRSYFLKLCKHYAFGRSLQQLQMTYVVTIPNRRYRLEQNSNGIPWNAGQLTPLAKSTYNATHLSLHNTGKHFARVSGFARVITYPELTTLAFANPQFFNLQQWCTSCKVEKKNVGTRTACRYYSVVAHCRQQR